MAEIIFMNQDFFVNINKWKLNKENSINKERHQTRSLRSPFGMLVAIITYGSTTKLVFFQVVNL